MSDAMPRPHPEAHERAFDRLSPKHKKFVAEFVKDFNGTKAYVRAGYAVRGARQNASRLMANDDICAAIEELMDRDGLTVNKVSMKLAEIGFDDDQKTRDQIMALDRLARVRGMVTTKHELKSKGPTFREWVKNASDEELLRIATGDARTRKTSARAPGRS